MKIRFYCLIVVLFLVGGCGSRAKSTVSSVRLDAVTKNYKNIGVGAITPDTTLSTLIENGFIIKFAENGISAISITKLKLRNPVNNSEELKKLLKSASVDGILIITLTDQGEKQQYIPGGGGSYSYGSGSLAGGGNWQNFYLSGQSQKTSSLHYHEGYYVTRHWAKGNAIFYDIDQDSPIWTSLCYTITKSSKANDEDMIKSAASETLAKLKADGVLR